jgi:hypothetical protein
VTTTEELKERFESLSNEDKLLFMRSIMPSFCEAFRKSPQNMMQFCQDMITSRGMDMQSMMKSMMGMINPSRG